MVKKERKQLWFFFKIRLQFECSIRVLVTTKRISGLHTYGITQRCSQLRGTKKSYAAP